MAAEAEHGQGDEGVGGFESEGDAGDEPDLGVDRFGVLGALNFAMCSLTCPISSALPEVWPAASTTKAFGRSPHRSSGTAMTATSATAGWEEKACSTSTVEMFSPPEITMSLARSINRM